ncbi:MAG: hypothetical protein GEV09_25070 [Pseudonocardiaceae bacterium]|nr:hypothetical protein [Pseudonocardiaceae bacterium]
MTSDNTMTTETTDTKPEGEQEEASAPAQPPESSPEKTADEGAAAATASAGGFGAGAAAAVSAGLGLASLTGTSLSDMLRSREEIVGQIEAVTGGGGDQVEALYGAPWQTAALVNGIFALVAVLVGGVLLAARARRADTQPWVKAVALGGVVLGGIGLLVAGGMYLDLFASQPAIPAAPGIGG